ncbi:hypothetical protein VHEMI09678 [[Torrubiella] hemipterigena]|uniref:Secreted protein n=1 Tax=[Torrubiella] hemipterigena TaxID=1531966 RepID=A0A0A1TRY9_9HYPO|nr:hypothetical protein VHEMI09678 [[Torrubiella] hemipterigena]
MHFLTTFVIPAILGYTAALTLPETAGTHQLQKRKCFATGQDYGDQYNEALHLADQVCSQVFAGEWIRGNKRSICYNTSGGHSVVFTLGLLGPNAGPTRTIGATECSNGMQKEVINCGKGGETTYGNWYYRSVHPLKYS